jgi:hypothetical protein
MYIIDTNLWTIHIRIKKKRERRKIKHLKQDKSQTALPWLHLFLLENWGNKPALHRVFSY